MTKEDFAKLVALRYPDPKIEDYDDILEYRNDRNWTTVLRNAVLEGYEQAEEDLALTVEDIATIHSIIGEVAGCPIKYDEEYYEEILRRFNENRKK